MDVVIGSTPLQKPRSSAPGNVCSYKAISGSATSVLAELSSQEQGQRILAAGFYHEDRRRYHRVIHRECYVHDERLLLEIGTSTPTEKLTVVGNI